jgi:hypothetical protein
MHAFAIIKTKTFQLFMIRNYFSKFISNHDHRSIGGLHIPIRAWTLAALKICQPRNGF